MKVADLFENTNSLKLSLASKALEYLLKGEFYLYRGYETSHRHDTINTFYQFDGNQYELTISKVKAHEIPRISKAFGKKNFLMRLADQDERWAEIPKRSFSTSVSNSAMEAYEFGPVGIVLPFDNVKNFASMRGDFNFHDHSSTKFAGAQVALNSLLLFVGDNFPEDHEAEFIEIMETYFPKTWVLFNSLRAKNGKGVHAWYEKNFTFSDLDDLSDFWQAFKTEWDRENKIRQISKEDKRFRLFNFGFHYHSLKEVFGPSLKESILSALDPENIGIKTHSNFEELASYFKNNKTRTQEIWFEGDYFLVQPELFKDLKTLENFLKTPEGKRFFQKMA